MLYAFSVLTTPGEFIKQLNTIIYIFLWKGTDKIARLAAINDLKYGGLNLIDLETYVKSSRLAWLGRIFAEGSSPWKAYINYLLKDFGGAFLFSCNYDVKDCEIISTFCRELLQWWADLRITSSTKPSILDIRIDNKTIYYRNYIKEGILLTNHLQVNKNNIES